MSMSVVLAAVAIAMRTNLWWLVAAPNMVAVGVFVSAARDSVWQICSFFVPLLLAVGLLAVRTTRACPAMI